MLDLLASLISLFVIAPLTGGTAAQMVSDIYLGNTVTLTGSLRAAWSRYGILLKSHIIPVIAILGGVVLFVVPGMLWYLSYLLITPIVMNEAVPGSRNIRRRSRDLVRGYRGKAFVILIVIVGVELLARAGIRSTARFFIGAAATTNWTFGTEDGVGASTQVSSNLTINGSLVFASGTFTPSLSTRAPLRQAGIYLSSIRAGDPGYQHRVSIMKRRICQRKG